MNRQYCFSAQDDLINQTKYEKIQRRSIFSKYFVLNLFGTFLRQNLKMGRHSFRLEGQTYPLFPLTGFKPFRSPGMD